MTKARRPASFSVGDGDARRVNDVSFDTTGPHPARQPESVAASLKGHGKTGNPAPGLSGFVLPAPKQSEQSRLVRLQLLRWLARYSGYDSSDKPARLTHLDYRDERAILIKGRMASAQIVWLGQGTLRRLLPNDVAPCPRRAP